MPCHTQNPTLVDWADKVFGDALPAPTVGTWGLSAEVDVYFGDGQVHADPLKFWQVKYIFSSLLFQVY